MKQLHTLNIIIPLLILAISGIFYYWNIKQANQSNSSHYNTLISISDTQPNIRLIQNTIKPLIDHIIQKETKTTNETLVFHIKPNHDITLYYLNDFTRGQEQIIQNIIQQLDYQPLQNLKLSTHLDFYGANNELVILVQHSKDLEMLHNKIKDLVHQADIDFYNTHHQHFYNQQKSEQYPYSPHITLGRLPQKDFLPSSKQEQNAILQQIKHRIQHEIFPVILTMISKNNALLGQEIILKKR